MRAQALCVFVAGLLGTGAARAQPIDQGTVELHAHLFMKEALGPLFRGRFEEGVRAERWDDRLRQDTDAASLERSGIHLVVVALFAHPIFGGDMRAQVRRQIDAAEAFVAEHPGWGIARNPSEARALLWSGRRVMVLSLEGASGVLESEEDLDELVGERGVSIVTPLHLVDDRYGGGADMDGEQALANPIGLLARKLAFGELPHNERGLTPLGERLALELVRRGVWLDLTHASEAALDKLVPIAEAAGQPLLLTHAQLRSHRAHERASDVALLSRVAGSGGVIGLMPAEGAQQHDGRSHCPDGCSAEACSQGANAFAAVYAEAVAALGDPAAVTLGSDWGGGVRRLAPSCATGTSLDAEAGFYTMGQQAELWRALATLGAPVAPAGAQLERFLAAWERVAPVAIASDRRLPELPARARAEGPSLSVSLALGGAHTSGADESALWLVLDAAVLRDTGVDAGPEPLLTIAPLEGELRAGFDERPPDFALRLSPVGIRARDRFDRLQALALPLRAAREQALDEELSLAASLGAAEMESALAAGTVRPLMLAGVEALGYQGLSLGRRSELLHGVRPIAGRFGFGLAIAAGRETTLRAVTDLAADVGVPLAPEPGFHSDLALRGGLRLDLPARLSLIGDARLVATYLSLDDDWRSALRVGAALGLEL